jgi:hypothetical protein
MNVALKLPALRHKTDPQETGLSAETGIGKGPGEVTDEYLKGDVNERPKIDGNSRRRLGARRFKT